MTATLADIAARNAAAAGLTPTAMLAALEARTPAAPLPDDLRAGWALPDILPTLQDVPA